MSTREALVTGLLAGQDGYEDVALSYDENSGAALERRWARSLEEINKLWLAEDFDDIP